MKRPPPRLQYSHFRIIMNFSLKSAASLLLLSLLSPLARCHADYNKNVIKLTAENFNSLVLKNEVHGKWPVYIVRFSPF